MRTPSRMQCLAITFFIIPLIIFMIRVERSTIKLENNTSNNNYESNRYGYLIEKGNSLISNAIGWRNENAEVEQEELEELEDLDTDSQNEDLMLQVATDKFEIRKDEEDPTKNFTNPMWAEERRKYAHLRYSNISSYSCQVTYDTICKRPVPVLKMKEKNSKMRNIIFIKVS